MTQRVGDVLLGVGDIAALVGVEPNVVSNWRRRAPKVPTQTASGWRTPFPSPDADFSTSARPVFRYQAVLEWLEANGKPVGVLPPGAVLWSARLQSLQGCSTTEAMLTVLALAVLRRLCEDEGCWSELVDAGEVSWDRFHNVVSRLGHDELVALPDSITRRPPGEVLIPLLDALGRVPTAELPELADAFLVRLDASLGRREARFGAVGSPVARLLGRVAADTGPVSILDPVAGVGGALTEAVAAGADPDLMVMADLHADALMVARRRLYLRGRSAQAVQAELPDGPGSAELSKLRCQTVVAEPPYSDEFELFAFLHFVAALLTEEGRGFVIVPASMLDSRTEEAHRRELLATNVVSAVVALPPKMLRHSSLPLALLVLRSPEAPRSDERVLLVDATASAVDELADAVATRLARRAEGADAVEVSARELLGAGSNLAPAAWMVGAPDVEEALTTLEYGAAPLRQAAVALESLDRFARPKTALTLLELEAAGTVRLLTGRSRGHQAGDVVVEAGETVETWVSDGADVGRGRQTVGITVLRPVELLPEYLALALRSNPPRPMLDVRQQRELVPLLRVPWLPVDEQQAFVDAHGAATAAAAHALALADALVVGLGGPS